MNWPRGAQAGRDWGCSDAGDDSPANSAAKILFFQGKAPGVWRFNFGAGEGIRTLDPNLGKVVLYP